MGTLAQQTFWHPSDLKKLQKGWDALARFRSNPPSNQEEFLFRWTPIRLESDFTPSEFSRACLRMGRSRQTSYFHSIGIEKSMSEDGVFPPDKHFLLHRNLAKHVRGWGTPTKQAFWHPSDLKKLPGRWTTWRVSIPAASSRYLKGRGTWS